MEKAYYNKMKTTQSQIQQNILTTGETITTNHWKQTSAVQSYTEANLDLRIWAMGNSVQFKHWDTAAVPVQDTKNNLKCSMVYQQHMIHNDLQMNTVKEVNRERTRKYLDKLKAHQIPLALNLFDNSEDIYRLKRYHVFDLPTWFKNSVK
jgi:hypothetical protein